ncbi:MAG: FMN-binding glutamate synthase family protein [Saprospiraceae bacterium]|jgi:glutamate synthase domain-containing protein 2|nr:FMN-binding glutamate synthase family protein [Saprospiraceae bacterium]
MNVRKYFIIVATVVILLTSVAVFWWPAVLWSTIITLPIILIGLMDTFNRKSAIKRNFPVIGHFRYLLESFRPEIQQYFVENDTDGKPINRMFRSLIYQRAKNITDTMPFGTKMDVYRVGYEWLNHSIYAKDIHEMEHDPRVVVGQKNCSKPYSMSLLNVSAMSFGSLSANAILALNKGARLGGFAHNTGEGGISLHHLQNSGDLIWQVGTGYFGCRTKDGNFCPDTFAKKAIFEQVKMIEIKLSQGAKPGHGGILPAAKNTKEIALIRDVEPFTDVLSPTYHKAFSDPNGLLNLIQKMRILSGGKPVGFKLCIGNPTEFEEICNAMVATQITPDFITIDGSEGGTGAAPVEFSNSLGMPLREGLNIAVSLLKKYDLKKDIIVIASGKILTAFHMARVFALGADACNSARAMMMALGCIQALQCNTNTCPVGVATQDNGLMKGLDVNDKAVRVNYYHANTIKAFQELLAAAGLTSAQQLTKKSIFRRISMTDFVTYDEIYK